MSTRVRWVYLGGERGGERTPSGTSLPHIIAPPLGIIRGKPMTTGGPMRRLSLMQAVR